MKRPETSILSHSEISSLLTMERAIEAVQKDAPLANANLWKSMHVEVYYKHFVLLGLLR